MAGIGVPANLPEGVGPKSQTEISIATVCQMGQYMVQELVQKVSEVFQNLKLMQLPYGTQQSLRSAQSATNKINEGLKQIDLHFVRLRQVYKGCQNKFPDDVDPCVLVPYVNTKLESGENIAEELSLQKSSKEIMLQQKKAELQAVLHAKNEQLKALVDQMRHLVWEVNSILALHDTV